MKHKPNGLYNNPNCSAIFAYVFGAKCDSGQIDRVEINQVQNRRFIWVTQETSKCSIEFASVCETIVNLQIIRYSACNIATLRHNGHCMQIIPICPKHPQLHCNAMFEK